MTARCPYGYYLKVNSVNLFSLKLPLNQILSSIKEQKLLFVIATEIGNVTKLLKNYVCFG
jgi:hypothetical protein